MGRKKQKAGRDRVEISIHLREVGCFLSAEATLAPGKSVYEKQDKNGPERRGRGWGASWGKNSAREKNCSMRGCKKG